MKNHYFLTASVLLAGLAAQPASAQFFVGMGAQSGRPAGMDMNAAMGRRPMPNGISVDDGMGGWKPYIPVRPSNVLGHSTYEGRKVLVTRNPDGSRDVTTEENGRSRTETRREMPGISVDDGHGGWKPYVAPPKSDVIGSGTYEGRTTTVRRNADGSRAVSMVDALGRVTERLAREPAQGTISVGDGMGGWVPYTPPARTGDFGSGSYEGRTTSVTRNPDGSHKVTVTQAPR